MQNQENSHWHKGWDLTDKEREDFRVRSERSRRRKDAAIRGDGQDPIHPINIPSFDPLQLMPKVNSSGLKSLSLFSGGGGFDLAFDLAGFDHVASYDILPIAGETILRNRPKWQVYSGDAGDVRHVNWKLYRDAIDVLHGGPPCQPFSMAGRQLGSDDTRNMLPEFVRAVQEVRPKVFVAENVAALGKPKFKKHLNEIVCVPLSEQYTICRFELKAEWFGVPQNRNRFFLVGFRDRKQFSQFKPPVATHSFRRLVDPDESILLRTMGTREALGLPVTVYDAIAPTIRSGFSGPRKTTSANNSVSSLIAWGKLGIWPHGVAANRHAAHVFVADNGHFRLSVQDCAILQGFPTDWLFCGAVYSVLGQIGNSVSPPMGYRVAESVAAALRA